MATTYTVYEDDARAIVKVQYTSVIDPKQVSRAFYSYTTSTINKDAVLQARKQIRVSAFTSTMDIRFRTKPNALGSSLEPGVTSYNSFNSGSTDEGTVTFTGLGCSLVTIKNSSINLNGNTDIRVASINEGAGKDINELIAFDTVENTAPDACPQLLVLAVDKVTPTTIRIPTSITNPTTKYTPSISVSSYNYVITPRLDGNVVAEIDPDDTTIVPENP